MEHFQSIKSSRLSSRAMSNRENPNELLPFDDAVIDQVRLNRHDTSFGASARSNLKHAMAVWEIAKTDRGIPEQADHFGCVLRGVFLHEVEDGV